MRVYWVAWALAFAVGEAFAVATGRSTLSAVWVSWRDTWPPVASFGLAAATGATLAWLGGPHWLWRHYDQPGLDRREVAVIVLGAVVGAASRFAPQRRKQHPNDDL